jgi:hypothetical protein
MTPMSPANRGNRAGMARSREPVVDGRPDLAALYRRIARAVMPGDQQDHSVAARDCLLQATIDRLPRSVERHPVEIERAIRLDIARPKPAVPA